MTKKPKYFLLFEILKLFHFLVHVNGFFALGQDRKDLKWKSLATVGSSNDKTVNWNQYLLTDLLPVVYENLFNFLKTFEVSGHVFYKENLLYDAWPDALTIDQKWSPILEKFYQQMQQNHFIYVKSQKKWYQPKDIWCIKKNEMTDDERKAVEGVLTTFNVPFAVVPEAVTNHIPECRWIDGYQIIQLICNNSNQYLKLGMKTQCNLLSYSVKTDDDLKLLINQKILPLSDGVTYFQLLRNQPANQYFVTTEEIPPHLLPCVKRNLSNEFFNVNEKFQHRLANILLKGTFS